MDPELLIPALWYICLVFSFTIHEAAHAISAHILGDDTPMSQGRVTLNPIAHMDPFGSVIVPIILLLTSPVTIGWAKPVEILPSNFKNPGRDDIIVTLAGPGSNLLVAILVVAVGRIVIETVGIENVPGGLRVFLEIMMTLNFLLAIFNMLPVPPLDGHHLLPEGIKDSLRQLGIVPLLIVFVAFPYIYDFFAPVLNFAKFLMYGQ